jgi:hypothetical protein
MKERETYLEGSGNTWCRQREELGWKGMGDENEVSGLINVRQGGIWPDRCACAAMGAGRWAMTNAGGKWS